jgi:alpha-L-fucosidase
MSVGPKRNIIKELKDAFMSRYPDFHFGLYYSLFEWFNPLYLKDKVNKMKTREFVMNKMLPEMKELAELVSPDVWWSDGDWEALPEYFRSKDFLAWLFNESPSKENVVVNDRWGSNTRLKHGSFFSGPDQWQPGYLIPHKWESAITVDKLSWGIRRNIKIEEVLSPEELISTVSESSVIKKQIFKPMLPLILVSINQL